MVMKGECNCGKVKVTVDDPTYVPGGRTGFFCHCSNCRKSSGSAMSTQILTDMDKVTFEGEENLRTYDDHNTRSGVVLHRSFCTTCGSPVMQRNAGAIKAGKVIIREGLFSDVIEPKSESFAINRMSWLVKREGATQFKYGSGGETLD